MPQETTADRFFSLLGVQRVLSEEGEEMPEAPPEDPVPGLADMPLSQIAGVIRQDWPNVDYAARPYLSAMFSLDKISDQYGHDSGHSIVAYFLNNATKWRGKVARPVKDRLRMMLKGR